MPTNHIPCRQAIVTGAAGGQGQACARALGKTMDLVLTDIADEKLAGFTEQLRSDGYSVTASIQGDLTDETVCHRVAQAATAGSGLGALVHTAAISQIMASWRRILEVDLMGTVRLLNAVEPLLQVDSAAVLIGSMAGHLYPANPEADSILDAPLAPTFFDRIEPLVSRMAGDDPRGPSPVAYAFAKRTIMRLCEQRAPVWALKGARIVSISPGMIWTPMGRLEADGNENASTILETTPMGRWGKPTDIANAVEFLVSGAASFITGTDLRVDGGATPVTLARLSNR